MLNIEESNEIIIATIIIFFSGFNSLRNETSTLLGFCTKTSYFFRLISDIVNERIKMHAHAERIGTLYIDPLLTFIDLITVE